MPLYNFQSKTGEELSAALKVKHMCLELKR